MSLGFAPLPQTFWERSLFTKPRIATWSATPAPGTWTTRTICGSRCASRYRGEDFTTIHHELGHNFYQRAYNKQPFLFQDSANDGFHEAIGDTIALSITPEYLHEARLARNRLRTHRRTSGCCCKQALDKVAFLPFGLLIDQWRWKVFSRRNHAGQIQRGLVGSAPEVSGRRAAGRAQRSRTSIPARNTTSRPTCPTRAISWRTFCNSSSTARSAASPDTKGR